MGRSNRTLARVRLGLKPTVPLTTLSLTCSAYKDVIFVCQLTQT